METNEKFRENKTATQPNNETINIPIYEILLIIGILTTIVGIIMILGIKEIDFLGISIWINTHFGGIIAPIGIGLICGYVTNKILPDKKGTFLLGLLLGIIGIIIAVCINIIDKPINNKYNDLQKLEELRQNGTITETEFKVEKDKILRRN